jgi:hypothetical protein
MVVELDAGRANQFPEVIWVDADKRGDAIVLIFGSRVEGQGAALRVTLTSPQWENLKFLVEGPTPGQILKDIPRPPNTASRDD